MKRILSVIVALALVSTLLTAFTSCGSSETADDSAEVQSTVAAVYTESAETVGKTSEEVLAYFNSLVNGVKQSKPAISYSVEKNVPDSSLKVTKRGAEAEEVEDSFSAINSAVKGVKDLILEDIKSSSGSVSYGADNTESLFVKGESWASALTAEDIKYATLKEVGDYYYITIAFNDLTSEEAQDVLTKAFDLRDKDEILSSEEFAKTKAYLALEDYDVVYSGCQITAKVDRLTNEITNINYYKASNVTAYMTAAGTLADYGEVSVMFTLEDKANFDITWDSGLPTSPVETAESAEA